MNHPDSGLFRSYGRGAVWGIGVALLLLALFVIILRVLFTPEMTAA